MNFMSNFVDMTCTMVLKKMAPTSPRPTWLAEATSVPVVTPLLVVAILHLPVVAAPLVAPTVEVVVIANEMMTVVGAVMSIVMMSTAGVVMSIVMMTAVEIGVMTAVIGAMMVVDGAQSVHPTNMLALIAK